MNAEYTGKKIAELRKSKNLTQKELAALVHVTDKAVSKWERGVNFPDLGLMEDLAKHLGTTPSVLLGLEDASRDEIVASFTELSAQQAEDAARDKVKRIYAVFGVALILSLAVMCVVHFYLIPAYYNEYLWSPFIGINELAVKPLFFVCAGAILAGLILRNRDFKWSSRYCVAIAAVWAAAWLLLNVWMLISEKESNGLIKIYIFAVNHPELFIVPGLILGAGSMVKGTNDNIKGSAADADPIFLWSLCVFLQFLHTLSDDFFHAGRNFCQFGAGQACGLDWWVDDDVDFGPLLYVFPVFVEAAAVV